MKYKGIELKEFTSDKPVVFDPPKMMLVRDGYHAARTHKALVLAYLPTRRLRVIGTQGAYSSCAEIPEGNEPRACQVACTGKRGNV